MPRAEPEGEAQPALVGADIGALPILDVHRNDGFAVVQPADLRQQRLVEMARDEQSPRAINELDFVLRVVAQRAAEDWHELSVPGKTVNFRAAATFRNLTLQAIMQRPHAAVERIHGNYRFH